MRMNACAAVHINSFKINYRCVYLIVGKNENNIFFLISFLEGRLMPRR